MAMGSENPQSGKKSPEVIKKRAKTKPMRNMPGIIQKLQFPRFLERVMGEAVPD
jgi:hypothetical protein